MRERTGQGQEGATSGNALPRRAVHRLRGFLAGFAVAAPYLHLPRPRKHPVTRPGQSPHHVVGQPAGEQVHERTDRTGIVGLDRPPRPRRQGRERDRPGEVTA